MDNHNNPTAAQLPSKPTISRASRWPTADSDRPCVNLEAGKPDWCGVNQPNAPAVTLAWPEDQRAITAHHEAGHAVAAVMRGELISTTIEPTDDYLGYTEFCVKAWGSDETFVTFAGPWAEARAQWPGGDEDDEGCTADDYIAGAFLANLDGDLDDYRGHLDRERALYGVWFDWIVGKGVKREVGWSRELEGVWPAIKAVAGLLLDGEHVDHATVEGLLDRNWGT